MITSSRKITILLSLCWLNMLLGCAGMRLPAIDPSGRGVLLPNPNYTTWADDCALRRLLPQTQRGTPLPGPYRGPLAAGPRQHFAEMLGGLGWFHDRLHQSLGCGRSAFPRPPVPPACGPDGNAPAGSPCYPVGSPTATSMNPQLPRMAGSQGLPTSGCNSCATGVAGSPNVPRSQLSNAALQAPGVVVMRRTVLAPVGSELVVVGGVRSPAGIFRPDEPVQWALSSDSVGTIVNAARYNAARKRGLLGFLHHARPAPAEPGCGSYVRTVTTRRCELLRENPADPSDDIYLARGQTWVRVTSASPGISYVTLSAPLLEGGNRRSATTQVIWVDAKWECPQNAVGSFADPGGAQLVTRVVKQSDGTPLDDWTVIYQILDGPEARFDDTGATRAEVRTNASGRAAVDVLPSGERPGVTRVRVQFSHPRILAGQAIGQCIAYVRWTERDLQPAPTVPDLNPVGPPDFEPPATNPDPTVPIDPPPTDTTSPPGPIRPDPVPDVPDRNVPDRGIPPRRTTNDTSLSISAQVDGPAELQVGEVAIYRVTVRNTGNYTAENVFVGTELLSGQVFDGSDPKAEPPQGRNIGWSLGSILVGEEKQVHLGIQLRQPGRYHNRFNTAAGNAPVQEHFADTLAVDGPPVAISVSDPYVLVNGQQQLVRAVQVGQAVKFQVTIENLRSTPVQVQLKHESMLEGTGNTDSTLAEAWTIAGQDRIVKELDFGPLEAGTFLHRVSDTLSKEETTFSTLVVAAPQPAEPEPRPQPQPPAGSPGTTPGTAQLRWMLDPFPEPSLEITVGVRDSLRLTVGNSGTAPLTNVEIRYESSDLLPAVGLPGDAVISNDGLVRTWRHPIIQPGKSLVIPINLQAGLRTGSTSHQLIINSDQAQRSVDIPIFVTQPDR